MSPIAVTPSRPLNGRAVIHGANQPEYQPLPSWSDDHRVITRWRLTWRERIAALFGRTLYMEVLTFGSPIQPIYPTFSEDEALYAGAVAS